MAIRAVATVSPQIYLCDISEKVKELEGDCKKDERAWVIVRQGTEGDDIALQELRSRSALRWDDGSPEETRQWNALEARAVASHRTMCDAGNIYGPEDKPLFSFETGKYHSRNKMVFSEFLEAWGSLQPDVVDAVLTAILSLNPQWEWFLPNTVESD